MTNIYNIICPQDKKYFIILLFLSSFIAFASVFFVIKFLFYGFEFSDESYYLLCIKYPEVFDSTISQFGIIYHPIFWLIDGNIAILRLINIIILLSIYVIVAKQIIFYFFPQPLIDQISPKYMNLLIPALATIPLSTLIVWLPTPNYNFLNIEACGLFLIGILRVSSLSRTPEIAKTKGRPEKDLAGWLIIGLGGFLSFMAKPTSGVVLAIILLLWAWLSSNFNVKGLLVSVITAFFLVYIVALFLDGSIAGFIERYQRGLDIEKINKLHGPVQFFNINNVLWTIDRYLLIKFIFFMIFGAIIFKLSEDKFRKTWIPILCIIFVSSLLLLIYTDNHLPYSLNFGHLLWLFPLGSLIIYFVKYHNIYSLKIKSKLGWLALFGSLSIVYAINSFNIITFAFSFSSFFIYLGFIAFFSYYSNSKHIFKFILSLILISQSVLIGILILSWRQPYRQYGPIWTYNTETQIPKGGYALKLYSEQSEFINNFYKISDQHGYITNTPIIDMTGSFLGAAYILNGYLPRTPWLYSGNQNSDAMVIAALKRLSCQELASAWLIIDPNFRRIFDPNVLLEAGLGDIKEYIFYGYAYFPVRTDDADIAYRPLGLISINGINKNVEICKAKRSQQHY